MRTIWYIFLLIYVYSCGTYRTHKPTNFSNYYKRDNQVIEGKYKVFHVNEKTSQVFFSFNTQQLLHVRNAADDQFSYKIELKYSLYTNFEKRILADSAKMYIENISNPYINKELQGYFEINDSTSNMYLLEIHAKDVFRNAEYISYITIDRTKKQDAHYYILKKNNRVVFDDVVYPGDTIEVFYNSKAQTNFMVNHFFRDFPPSLPPFSFVEDLQFKFETEKIFKPLVTDSSIQIVTDKPGIYFLRQDTSLKEGFSIYCFKKEAFPEFSDYAELIGPLRYITSKKEFIDIQAGNQRQMFEKFWLNITGNNHDRSRELIHEYYQRVFMANKLFTSYTEGWKTDRGMIYIVFGIPSAVYKTTQTENWIYGEDNHYFSVSFSFSKVQNPLSENDYILSRSSIYRSIYYKGVDNWRQGRIIIQ